MTLVTGPSEGDEGELETRARKMGARVILVPDLVREPSPVQDVRALRALCRIMRGERCTLVHTHTSKAGILGRVAARMAGVPAVVHTPHGHVFHSYYGPTKTRLFCQLERFCARYAHRIITLTENEKREHVELRIAPAERFTTIHSGVDLSRFERAPHGDVARRSDFGIPADAPVIVCVARLVPIKGHEHLIAAMPAVLDAFPEARLLLVGDGPLADELQAQAERAGVAQRVVFAGLRFDIPDLLRLSDIFALASLNEGMGRVLVEAMACRLPVVATRVSGIPDVVDDGVTGLLADSRSPDQMARALCALLSDPVCAHRMGEAGYRKVVPAFGVDAMVERINTVYEEVLKEKGIRWMNC